jgi:hypothetical protein
MGIAGEALGASSLPNQDRGAERAAAGLGEQLRAMRADEVTQLALERLGFPRQRSDAFDLLASDANPGRLWQCSESTGDALQLAGVVQLARGDLRLKLGVEDDEIPAQPIDQPRALGNQDLPVIAQQPDLDGLLVEESHGKPLDSLTQYRAGNRPRVDLVRLSGSRSPRREAPISFGATRKTRSLAATSERSKRCETCRQSSTAHAISWPSSCAQRSPSRCPCSVAAISHSPSTCPVSASTAARAWVRLWVSTPITIIRTSFQSRSHLNGPPADSSEWGRLPRSYQVTP